jgi:hypothetical protein
MSAKQHQRLGDGPIEAKHHKMMNTLAHTLDELFNGDARGPDRQTGFILMVFPFGNTDGRANYISNAERADVVTMLKEQLARFEGQPEMSG